MLMRSQTTEGQLKTKRACASNCTLTSTSLSLHKSGSTGLFRTSSCRKHFDFPKVEIQDTVAHDQGFAHLCDLFHNLWNWDINIRRMPTSRFIRRIPASRFIRRIPASRFILRIPASRFIQRTPASRFIQQLTHWLCMPLFSSSANRCQHGPAGATHQKCELYTQVRQSHGFSPR